MSECAVQRKTERGNALVVAIVMVMIIASVATPVLMRGLKGHSATRADVVASRLLFVAESGLDYNYLLMAKDPLYCVRPGPDSFDWNSATQQYDSDTIDLTSAGAGTAQSFRYSVQYLNAGVPVKFAVFPHPVEPYDTIRVTVNASVAGASRQIVAYYAMRLKYRGAIVSDMPPTADVKKEKDAGKAGHISITGKGRPNQHAIFGDMLSNGKVIWSESLPWVPLTPDNASGYLLAHSGAVSQDLYGTPDEIPDFTNLGGPDQLFDFDRAELAAKKGAGAVYASLAEFQTAMAAANALGQPLEGIQFINVDPAVEGGSPKIDLAGGVHITGSLAIKFATGTDPEYKIIVTADVEINAADLSSVDYADESTYTSGYPGTYLVPDKMPSSVNLPGFTDYTPGEDIPAVMFNNGIVDFHGKTNICGMVYGPSFIEIENKTAGNVQYFNGAIYGGGGVYLEGNSSSGYTAIRYDSNTMDGIRTLDGKGLILARIGMAIGK